MRKPAWPLVLGLCLGLSCNNKADTESSAADTVEAEEGGSAFPALGSSFPHLFAYLHSQDSSFAVEQFEGGLLEGSADTARTRADADQLQDFMPLLLYNRDSTLAIDFVSYHYVLSKKEGRPTIQQGGPDTEVGLVDLEKNWRKRILYLGSSGTVLDARWADDSVILMAGAEEMEEGRIRPAIWTYHIGTGERGIYTYPQPIRANIEDYTEKVLTKKLQGVN